MGSGGGGLGEGLDFDMFGSQLYSESLKLFNR